MEIYLPVKVYLAQSMRDAYDGFSTDLAYDAAGMFEISSKNDAIEDLEQVFAICNSDMGGVFDGVEYPPMLHCDGGYLDVVDNYRAAGCRSLSVGDVVEIGEAAWYCASFGWELAVGFDASKANTERYKL